MTAIVTLSITGTSAVAQEYKPVYKNGNVVTFANTDLDRSAEGTPTITLEYKPKVNGRATSRVHGQLALPYEVVDANGNKTYPHVARFTFEFVIPSGISSVARDDLIKQADSLLSRSPLHNMVKGPEGLM